MLQDLLDLLVRLAAQDLLAPLVLRVLLDLLDQLVQLGLAVESEQRVRQVQSDVMVMYIIPRLQWLFHYNPHGVELLFYHCRPICHIFPAIRLSFRILILKYNKTVGISRVLFSSMI